MKTYSANEEAKKLAEENMAYIVMMMEMAYNRGYTAGMKEGGDIAMQAMHDVHSGEYKWHGSQKHYVGKKVTEGDE